MKVLYSANLNLQRTGAGTVHVFECCKELAKRGILLALLHPAPLAKRAGPLLNPYMKAIPTIVRGPVGIALFDIMVVFHLLFFRLRHGKEICLYVRPHVTTCFQLLAARLLGYLVLFEINGAADLEYKMSGRNRFLVALGHFVALLNCRLANRIICVTTGLRSYYIKTTGTSAAKFAVVSNGVDPNVFYPRPRTDCRAKFGMNNDRCILGFVGSFAVWQGLERTLQAVCALPLDVPLSLVMVGGGRLENSLRAIPQKAPPGRVIFRSWVPHDEVPELISCFDWGLLIREYPGDLPLGSPLKLFEYLACGVPVIGTDVDGIRDIGLSEEQLLLLSPSISKEQIVRALLEKVLPRRFDDCQRQAIHKVIREHWSWASKVAQIAEIISSGKEQRCSG